MPSDAERAALDTFKHAVEQAEANRWYVDAHLDHLLPTAGRAVLDLAEEGLARRAGVAATPRDARAIALAGLLREALPFVEDSLIGGYEGRTVRLLDRVHAALAEGAGRSPESLRDSPPPRLAVPAADREGEA